MEDLDYFLPGSITNETELTERMGIILSILSAIGSIISIVTIIIIGIKYMIGSVEEKASYKKVMIPWVIGAVLVFSVSVLPNIIYQITTSALE